MTIIKRVAFATVVTLAVLQPMSIKASVPTSMSLSSTVSSSEVVHTFGQMQSLGTSGVNEELKQVLEQLNGFESDFDQTVIDTDGNIIHSAKGKLVFKQPGKFIWQVTEPEEEILISDGESVWWYNPFVEQVSIYEANHAVTTTPFALLVNNDPSVWENFSIQTLDDGFVITPNDLSDAQVIRLEIKVSDSKVGIEKMMITSRSRQVSEYVLSNQRKSMPMDDVFSFSIPDGIDVDDQRTAAINTSSNGNVQY